MKITLNKVASVLAFVIGTMAIFAGGQVLIGKDPGYYVIDWLPLCNYTIGILTVFITALLIWINNKLARPAAVATFSIHAIIMLLLQTVYRNTVAMDSVVAMTLRLATWSVILTLMFFQLRKSTLERG